MTRNKINDNISKMKISWKDTRNSITVIFDAHKYILKDEKTKTELLV